LLKTNLWALFLFSLSSCFNYDMRDEQNQFLVCCTANNCSCSRSYSAGNSRIY
jgi:hypothetical protein